MIRRAFCNYRNCRWNYAYTDKCNNNWNSLNISLQLISNFTDFCNIKHLQYFPWCTSHVLIYKYSIYYEYATVYVSTENIVSDVPSIVQQSAHPCNFSQIIREMLMEWARASTNIEVAIFTSAYNDTQFSYAKVVTGNPFVYAKSRLLTLSRYIVSFFSLSCMNTRFFTGCELALFTIIRERETILWERSPPAINIRVWIAPLRRPERICQDARIKSSASCIRWRCRRENIQVFRTDKAARLFINCNTFQVYGEY